MNTRTKTAPQAAAGDPADSKTGRNAPRLQRRLAAKAIEDLAALERVADHLARGSDYAANIARATSANITQIRRILLDMERIGLVVRTGLNRGTVWHLG